MSHVRLDATGAPDATRRINQYLDHLLRWSRAINLTGAMTREQAMDTLVNPVLGAESLVHESVIDVGSGNGSPGLILAALRSDIPFTLLEPRAKRWAFLRDAVREMGLENVTVRRERSETYGGPPARTVTIRAVGLAPERLRPLLLPGGTLLIFGGPEQPGCETLLLPSGARVQRQCFT